MARAGIPDNPPVGRDRMTVSIRTSPRSADVGRHAQRRERIRSAIDRAIVACRCAPRSGSRRTSDALCLSVLPNLAFFSLFVFVPIGHQCLLLGDRRARTLPVRASVCRAGQYAYLFDCASFVDPSSCREDHFWRGVYNTLLFALFQVTR